MNTFSLLLLRLRSWQLVGLLYRPAVVALFFIDPRNQAPSGMIELVMISVSLWASGLTFFWVWSVGRTLAVMKRDSPRSNALFRVSSGLTEIATGVFLLLMVADLLQIDLSKGNAQFLAGIDLILNLIVLIGFLGLVYVTGYTAKKIAEVEYFPVKVSFIDYVGSFFAIWFFPIGVWVLQPRLNRIVSNWDFQQTVGPSITS